MSGRGTESQIALARSTKTQHGLKLCEIHELFMNTRNAKTRFLTIHFAVAVLRLDEALMLVVKLR